MSASRSTAEDLLFGQGISPPRCAVQCSKCAPAGALPPHFGFLRSGVTATSPPGPRAACHRALDLGPLVLTAGLNRQLSAPNGPRKPTSVAERGRRVFQREGCAACHTPPLYSNGKLTPVEGFRVPDDHRYAPYELQGLVLSGLCLDDVLA